MEQLKACYDQYFEQAEKVWEERSAWDGALGIGESSKDHPCHVAFYKNVQAWVENFLKGNPDQETAEAALTCILQTSENHKGQFTYWSLFAAHGLARALVPYISPRYAQQMRLWYESNIPRRMRMPVHKDLLKLLIKREKSV